MAPNGPRPYFFVRDLLRPLLRRGCENWRLPSCLVTCSETGWYNGSTPHDRQRSAPLGYYRRCSWRVVSIWPLSTYICTQLKRKFINIPVQSMIPFSIFSIHDYTVRYIDNLPIVFFENKTGKYGEFLSLLKETSDATPISGFLLWYVGWACASSMPADC